jgi:hypothetical protein
MCISFIAATAFLFGKNSFLSLLFPVGEVKEPEESGKSTYKVF